MSTRAWIGFATLSTVWGIPYLFIKVGIDGGIPPWFLAFARVALAAAVLLVLAWRAGTLGSVRGKWRWVALYALMEICVPFPMIAFGETRISSSLTAIMIATVPLLIALLALRFDHAERVTGQRLVGLLIGLGGVVALVGIDVSGNSRELVGAAAILLAALGYASGPMVLKRHLTELDARATMGAALAIAAVVLAPAAAIDHPTSGPTGGAIAAVAVLGLVCTAAAFVVLAGLVREIGPSRTSVITYINPVIAVALGVAILGERPGAGAIAGLLLILAGSWLSTGGSLPPGLRVLAGRSDAARVRRRPVQPPPEGVSLEPASG